MTENLDPTPTPPPVPSPAKRGRVRVGAWYREPLVWLLIVPPAAAVIGGIVTIYLAVSTDDGLVVDDYYAQGKAINQTLARDQAAHTQGLRARLQLHTDRAELRLDGAAPPEITLRLLHATRAAQDVVLTLDRAGDGVYRAPLPTLAPGRWHVQLEAEDWRLTAATRLPEKTTVDLGAP